MQKFPVAAEHTSAAETTPKDVYRSSWDLPDGIRRKDRVSGGVPPDPFLQHTQATLLKRFICMPAAGRQSAYTDEVLWMAANIENGEQPAMAPTPPHSQYVAT